MRQLLGWIVVATLGASTTARANGFPRPKVDFAADGALRSGPMNIETKVFYSGNKERREHQVQGRHQVIIVRRDKKVVWILLPEPKMYMEMGLEQSHGTVGDFPAGARVDKSKVGNDTVNGQATTKYHIEVTQKDGAKLSGFMWVTPDDIVMKMEANAEGHGSKTAIDMELRNVKRGKQDPGLFEVPQGYSTVPAAGAMGGSSPDSDGPGSGAPSDGAELPSDAP